VRNYSGRSVSSAGDVNGDGLDDLIIGAYSTNPNDKSNAGVSDNSMAPVLSFLPNTTYDLPAFDLSFGLAS
jgi:hypothetical protein